MGRRLIAVMAAVVIALFGAVAVFAYARGADQRAVAGQQPVPVFVAQKVIPAGTSAGDALRGGLLVETRIPAKALPAGALSKVDDATAKLLALTDIAPGEYVLASRFGTTPMGQKALQVPDGQVALAVNLSDPARVGSFITPGSHIVIYDSYTPGGGSASSNASGPGRETQVLLDDVLVIAVGASSLTPVQGSAQQQGQQAAPSALVTVALPPATAVKLVHGIQTGSLYAGLRGTDAKVDGTQGVTDASLFSK